MRMKKRPRVIHKKDFQQRLADEAQRYRDVTASLPPGQARELLLRRVRRAESCLSNDDWLSRPDCTFHRAEESPWPSEVGRTGDMQDYHASLERLRKEAADAALVRDLATDKAKQELYDRLYRTSTNWRMKSSGR
jgi:hypothetical protein